MAVQVAPVTDEREGLVAYLLFLAMMLFGSQVVRSRSTAQ